MFRSSVSADHIVLVASRLLGAAAACVILCCLLQLDIVLEWPHQGRNSDLSADFLNFGAGVFPFKCPFKSASKSCVKVCRV